jgi:prepilin-type N-terminal cleavage/methylation domain-containing protein
MQRRQGFTLPELLVSMAIIVFMMVIIAECFGTALVTFTQMKTAGDMQERLRNAAVIIRRDLAGGHFSRAGGVPLPLSDPSMDLTVTGVGGYTPPDQGYFRIWHGSASGAAVNDLDGKPEYATLSHALQFTVNRGYFPRPDIYYNLNSAAPQAYLSSSVPVQSCLSPWYTAAGGSVINGQGDEVDYQYDDAPPLPAVPLPTNSAFYRSQWAEVTYVVRQVGTYPNGNNRYALFRRQLLPVNYEGQYTTLGNNPGTTPTPPTLATSLTSFRDVCCQIAGANIHFNSLKDLTIPQRRFGMDPSVAWSIGPPPNYSLGDGGIPVSGLAYPGIATPPLPTYPVFGDSLAGAPGYATYYSIDASRRGDDILLTDVLSFDVRFLRADSTGAIIDSDFIDLFYAGAPALPPQNNTAINTNGGGARVFDTWTSYNDGTGYDYTNWDDGTNYPSKRIPLRIRIFALQITMRIYDIRSQQTRQITIVQNM